MIFVDFYIYTIKSTSQKCKPISQLNKCQSCIFIYR